MKIFEYTITYPEGIHLRPAGMIVNVARKYDSRIEIVVDNKRVPADNLMAIIAMGIRKGTTISIEIEGSDEEEAKMAMLEFFQSIS